MKSKTTIYLLCSPHIGLLDNWLPVVYRINELKGDFNYVLIFSDEKIVSTIESNNAIIKIANDIFNSVVFYSPSGLWIKVDSLENLKINSNFIWRLLGYYISFSNRFLLAKKLLPLLKYFCMTIDIVKFRDSIIDLKSIIMKNDILLYDVHTHSNPFDLNLISKFKSYKFSIPHGIMPKPVDHIDFNKGHTINKNSKLKIFIFSKNFQYEYYLNKYGTASKDIIAVGIPRHDKRWIDKIQQQSSKLPINFRDKNTVLIISAKVNSYLPRNRKIKSLEDIRSIIIDNLKMKVVIKLHPKELKEGIYEDVFNKKNYGKTWIYSDLHPFVLAKGKKLSISLFTGVSFDMLRLGIPCIEYIDLQDIPGFIIINNKPVTPFARYGFVTSVSNYDEFKFEVNRIIKSSDFVSSSIKKYSEYCPMDDASSDRAASNIIQLISDKK